MGVKEVLQIIKVKLDINWQWEKKQTLSCLIYYVFVILAFLNNKNILNKVIIKYVRLVQTVPFFILKK